MQNYFWISPFFFPTISKSPTKIAKKDKIILLKQKYIKYKNDDKTLSSFELDNTWIIIILNCNKFFLFYFYFKKKLFYFPKMSITLNLEFPWWKLNYSTFLSHIFHSYISSEYQTMITNHQIKDNLIFQTFTKILFSYIFLFLFPYFPTTNEM